MAVLEDIRDDNKTFMDLYEAPTKLYRLLSKRPATFLQRNLTYIAKRRKRSPGPRVLFEKDNKDLSAVISSEPWLELEARGVDGIGPMLPPASGHPVPGGLRLQVFLVHTDYGSQQVLQPTLLGSCQFAAARPGKVLIQASSLLEYNFGCLLLKVSQEEQEGPAPPSLPTPDPAPVRCPGKSARSAGRGRGRGSPRKRHGPARTSSKNQEQLSEKRGSQLQHDYVANLSLYDSTHRCLLGSGSARLLLHREGRLSRLGGPHGAIKWKTIFGMTDEEVAMSEEASAENFVLNVNLVWIGGAPKLSDVSVHLSSMRAEYDNKFPRLRRRDAPKPSSSASLVEGQQEKRSDVGRVVYSFLYHNNRHHQVTVVEHLACPWCDVKWTESLDLLMHLKLNHSLFVFSYSPLNGGCKLDVRVDPVERERCTELDRFVVSKKPRKRQSLSELVTWKAWSKQDPSLRDFLPENCLSVYDMRSFYHGHSFLPIAEDEYNVDSEAEDSPPWLDIKMRQMIEEFSDISPADKQLMMLWNSYTLKNRIISFKQVYDECRRFASLHRSVLLRDKALLVAFQCHLAHLHERGILSGSQIVGTMAALDSEEPRST